jgi:PD-(D/E)XK endonuclease
MNTTSRNVRTWTDEQLRATVAAETTWRAVARALGLAQSSTNGIKRHTARLRLDTSHFSGKRRWSAGDLVRAVDGASSWAEVMSLLSISDTSEARLRVKGYAVRLGLDLSRVERAHRKARSIPNGFTAQADPAHLRVAAEAIAIAWFTVRGVAVAVPSGPREYDLLVTFTDGIKRVQVKSSTCRTRNGTWAVIVGHRPYSLDKTASIAPYDPDSLDYFFIIDGDGAVYLIPSRVLAGRIRVTGRVRLGLLTTASRALHGTRLRVSDDGGC